MKTNLFNSIVNGLYGTRQVNKEGCSIKNAQYMTINNVIDANNVVTDLLITPAAINKNNSMII
jgi:hypothetical protein